ncbi:MAG: hypothetical protein ACRC31_06230 [Cetobacterium sp.]
MSVPPNVNSKDAIFTLTHPVLLVPITLTGFAKDMMVQFTEYDAVGVDRGADGETIAWGLSVYPDGKITIQPNSRTNQFIEAIQVIQDSGIINDAKLTIQVPSIRKIFVLDKVVFKSGLQPPSLEQRVMDKSFNFHYIPNAPIDY